MSDQPLKLFTGNANRPLAEAVAEKLLMKLSAADVDRFADGEVKVRIKENVRAADVFILQPLDPTDQGYLMESLQLIDAAVNSSAGRVTYVMPYYGYARQDRKDQPRVPISARIVADVIQSVQPHRVVLVDPHTDQVQSLFRPPCQSDRLYVRPVILKQLKGMFPDARSNQRKLLVVAPDAGATKTAQSYANRLGCRMVFFHKQRFEEGKVGKLELVGKVHGRTTIMVDDIVDSAGTITEAAAVLKRQGAERILSVAFHPVLSGSAGERIQDSPIDEMLVTDTLSVPEVKRFPKLRIISIATLLAEAISAIHQEKSVSSLID